MTVPAGITDSRVRRGTLTIDGISFATQPTNVKLSPDFVEDGDRVEVLSGDVIEPDETTTWALNITAIQDFDDPAGFIAFALDNNGEVVPFVWKPNDVAGSVSYSGTVKVRAVEIGGDVASRNTSDAEWAVKTGPTPAYGGV